VHGLVVTPIFLLFFVLFLFTRPLLVAGGWKANPGVRDFSRRGSDGINIFSKSFVEFTKVLYCRRGADGNIFSKVLSYLYKRALLSFKSS
jgi:hypothetical protein